MNPILWWFLLSIALFVGCFLILALMLGLSFLANWIWPGSTDPKPGDVGVGASGRVEGGNEPTAGQYFYDDFGGDGGG